MNKPSFKSILESNPLFTEVKMDENNRTESEQHPVTGRPWWAQKWHSDKFNGTIVSMPLSDKERRERLLNDNRKYMEINGCGIIYKENGK